VPHDQEQRNQRRQQQLNTVLAWVGHGAPPNLFDRLEQIETWIDVEGRNAGGIGPDEEIWERHILDSLMFSRGFPTPPKSLIDLGGGLGLPSLALASLFPDTQVRLIDRSEKRTRLVRRACRITGLSNLKTEVRDVTHLASDSYDAVVMRAVLPPTQGPRLIRRVLRTGGVGVFGVGLDMFHVKHSSGLTIRFPGSEVLDPGRWIHIMQGL
jgi:2-polyprenyl-3-methyl-5-hydroxy-6-metoxy-1,4-benzoquinol methylase